MKRVVFIFCLSLFSIGYVSGQIIYAAQGDRLKMSDDKIQFISDYTASFEEGFYELYQDGFRILKSRNHRLAVLEGLDYGIVFDGSMQLIEGAKPFGDNEFVREGYYGVFSYVQASSYLTETLNGEIVSYPPEHLLDRNYLTPWVCSNSNGGVGEKLVVSNINFEFNKLLFVNGFLDPRDLSLYGKNSRVREIKIYFPSGSSQNVVLRDTPNPQIIHLDENVLRIEIEVVRTYPGSIYSDLAIAGIMGGSSSYPSEERFK